MVSTLCSQGLSFVPEQLKAIRRVLLCVSQTFSLVSPRGTQELTCREACPLVAACELYVEISHQGMDVIISLYLEAEWRGEAEVINFNGVNIHFLKKRKN